MDLTTTNYCAVCRKKIHRPPSGGPWQHADGKPCPGPPAEQLNLQAA